MDDTAKKLRAVLRLLTIILGIVMIILHIVAIAGIGSLTNSITEIEKLMYHI